MGIFTKPEKILSAAPYSLPAGVLSDPIDLAQVIFPDLDTSEYPVTIGEAMTVPAVSRAIALYSTLSSRFVLAANDGSASWLTTGYGPLTPQMRIAFTVQDLIFFNQRGLPTVWLTRGVDSF